jgi:hypothetical protein
VEPILDRNKAAANDASGPMGDMVHVASIPSSIQLKWLIEHGIDITNKDHMPGVGGCLTATNGDTSKCATSSFKPERNSNGCDVRRKPSANFTRPADTTAYASGDLVANSTTVGSVVPLTFSPCTKGAGRSAQIRRVRISKTGTSITNTTVRVHLFNVLPTVSTNGDNGAITIATGAAGYLGQVDVVINQAFTDGAAGLAHHRDQLQQPDALRAA